MTGHVLISSLHSYSVFRSLKMMPLFLNSLSLPVERSARETLARLMQRISDNSFTVGGNPFSSVIWQMTPSVLAWRSVISETFFFPMAMASVCTELSPSGLKMYDRIDIWSIERTFGYE